MQNFDLNIEKILENWGAADAIREIIANALDEQLLSQTEEIEITKNDGVWCIRDYGRGLKYQHLTQNENPEKETREGIIGRFGVGLKDALATLYNNNIGIEIKSKYAVITLKKCQKSSFEDVSTLHAVIDQPEDGQMVGTAVYLFNCPDEEIERAKAKFLRFTGERILEKTDLGQIIEKKYCMANIYINGVKVAEEPNFAFSYNITSLTQQIKKSLNRERSNVGRSAYTERVKAILKMAMNRTVIETLRDNFEAYSDGSQCEEIKWIDVASYVAKMLNEQGDAVFVKPDEMTNNPAFVNEILHNSGKRIIIAPENVIEKASRETFGGLYTTESAVVDYNKSFSYSFVSEDELTEEERANWNTIPQLLRIFQYESMFEKCYISETMREECDGFTFGIWDKELDRIIIHRSQVRSKMRLYGTVLHEVIHAKTGYSDISREFENQLTNTIGVLSTLLLNEIKDKIN